MITRDSCDGCERNDRRLHVLPSFEMYRALHEATVVSPSSEAPPDYDAPASTRSITSQSISSVPSEHFSHGDFGSTTTPHLYPDSTLTPASSPILNPGVLIDPLKVHNLPKMPTSPFLTVKIHVTKTEPPLDTKPQLETIFKEYTTSDVIHGYVVIQNATRHPIPFTTLYVTLEGTTTTHNPLHTQKYHIHRFLHMMDLHASYSTGCVCSSHSTECHFGHIDVEGCQIGLPTDRILQPQMKYRKDFSFKLPDSLLDTTCRHAIHHELPPSVGFNSVYKNMKYAECSIDHRKGYGHLGLRGSPVVVSDWTTKVSVDYNVNATLVGSHPTLKDDSGISRPAVMKDEDFSLRIVPSGVHAVGYGGRGEVDLLKASVENSIRNAERMIVLCAEQDKAESVTKLDHDIKEQQLQLNTVRLNGETSKKPSSTVDHSASMQYVPKQKKNSLFGRKETISTSSGIITVTAQNPSGNLPYRCPDVLKCKPSSSTTDHITVRLDLAFTPSDLATIKSTHPPEISEAFAKLHMTTIASTVPIPITITDDLDLGEIQSEFKTLNTRIIGLRTTFENQSIPEFEDYVPTSLQIDVQCIAGLTKETSIHDVLVSKTIKDENWERQTDGKWIKSVKMSISVDDPIYQTLIPEFQTCIATRAYSVSVHLRFRGAKTSVVVKVPVRLYK